MSRYTRPRLVIIGNGMATEYLLNELGTDHGYDIRVLGGEPVPYYNRIMLSPLLGEEVDLASISPRDEHWYRQRNTRVSPGKPVQAVEPQHRRVRCADGEWIGYDRLVLATGARPRLPELPGQERAGICPFRSLADVRHMQAWCRPRPGAPVVVIGGGLLGVEAAVGLSRLGMDVHLVHHRQVLMNRQLDETAARRLGEALQARGIRLHLGCTPRHFHGGDSVESVAVEHQGRVHTLPAGLVVCATGITPNAELAAEAGLDHDRGIRVDATLTSSEPAIHALGECCQFGDTTYGLVAPIQTQAEVLAANLRGEHRLYDEPVFVTRLKVSGLDIHSMGVIEPAAGQETLWLGDARAGIYRKLVLEHGRLVGALLVGDVRLSPWYFELLASGRNLDGQRSELLLGPSRVGREAETGDGMQAA